MGGTLTYESDRNQKVYIRFEIPVTVMTRFNESTLINPTTFMVPAKQENALPNPEPIFIYSRPEDLEQLSPDWIDQLEQAAIRGNDASLERLIRQLPEDKVELRNILLNANLNFRFDIILKFVTETRNKLNVS
jgi:hypothetical protein